MKNLVRVALHGDGESPTKSKIGDLKNSPVLINKEILWLKIPVEDAMAVTMSDALTELEEKTLDYFRRNDPGIRTPVVRINERPQVRIHVLKNEVENRLSVLPMVENVLDAEQADNVQ